MPLIQAVLASSKAPANSDYFPFLDLRAGEARFSQRSAHLFQMWGIAQLPVLEMLGLEPFDYTTVASDGSLHRTTLIDQARKLRKWLIEGNNRADSALGAAATLVNMFGRSCDTTLREEAWLSSLHTIAQWSLSFSSASDASATIALAMPQQCAATASPRLRTWVELYQAIAARDAHGMVAAGTAALEQPGLEEGRLHYALTAAMLGHLAAHRPDKTLELWHGRPAPLGNTTATPDIELVIRVAEKRLADGLVVSQSDPLQ
jgi:hypothetical protein